jgi:hypothetical protein
VLSNDQILTRLHKVDWNFPGSTTLEHSVHALHWFPGNFIPEIPSFLIEILSSPGQTVLDPFCGSGTTGIEALRLGRCAILSDINSASIQVTKGKLAVMRAVDRKGALLDVGRELTWASFGRSDSLAGQPKSLSQNSLVTWFHPNTLSQLELAWNIVERIQDPDIRSIAEMVFSDTLFGCASTSGMRTGGGKRRRHHWGWVADNVKPKNPVFHDAIEMFIERLEKAVTVVDGLSLGPLPQATISRCDARHLELRNESVDLVVTSPPYLGMIDYTLSNRLTYFWFDWPLEEDRLYEIGARFRRRRRNIVEEYLEEMRASLQEIHRCLRVGSYFAIVIGSSRRYSDVVNQVIKAASSFFSAVWGPIPRTPTRRRVSDRGGTEPKEFVCVFQKNS